MFRGGLALSRGTRWSHDLGKKTWVVTLSGTEYCLGKMVFSSQTILWMVDLCWWFDTWRKRWRLRRSTRRQDTTGPPGKTTFSTCGQWDRQWWDVSTSCADPQNHPKEPTKPWNPSITTFYKAMPYDWNIFGGIPKSWREIGSILEKLPLTNHNSIFLIILLTSH